MNAMNAARAASDVATTAAASRTGTAGNVRPAVVAVTAVSRQQNARAGDAERPSLRVYESPAFFVAPPGAQRPPAALRQWNMSASRAATALVLVLVGASCSRSGSPAPPAAAPTRTTVLAPAPAVTLAAVADPSPTPELDGAVYEMRLPTRTPIPAQEPAAAADERTLPRESRRQQIARCLLLRADLDPSVSFSSGRARLEVHAHNACGFAILGSETSFRLEALPLNGGSAVAREAGLLQTGIEPNGSASTLIEIDCPGWRQCRYAVRATGGEGTD